MTLNLVRVTSYLGFHYHVHHYFHNYHLNRRFCFNVASNKRSRSTVRPQSDWWSLGSTQTHVISVTYIRASTDPLFCLTTSVCLLLTVGSINSACSRFRVKVERRKHRAGSGVGHSCRHRAVWAGIQSHHLHLLQRRRFHLYGDRLNKLQNFALRPETFWCFCGEMLPCTCCQTYREIYKPLKTSYHVNSGVLFVSQHLEIRHFSGLVRWMGLLKMDIKTSLHFRFCSVNQVMLRG